MLRRSTAALIWKAAEGIVLTPGALVGKAELGLERRQAVKSIGSLMAACTAVGMMIHQSGNNKKVFDTDSADFMSMKFGDTRVGIGTPFYALSRMGSALVNQLKDDPAGLGKWDIEDHAVLKWARSSLSPSSGTIVDLIHGRTFIGDPLRDADGGWEKLKITRFLGRQGAPFWGEAFLFDFQGFGKLASIGEFAGMRASPLPKSAQLRELRELYLASDMDDAELLDWRAKQMSEGKPITVEEAPAMIIDRLALRHDDIAELDEMMQQNRLFRADPEQKRLNDYMTALETNRKSADLSMMGFNNSFARGEMDGKTFRTKITEASAELRGAQESLANVFEDVLDKLDSNRVGKLEIGEGYVGDLLYDIYRAKVTDNPGIEDEFGNFRPEEFRKLEASFRSYVGDPDSWDYIQRRKKRGRNVPPLVTELYEARETLRPYWSLYETVWKRGSWQSELVADYMDRPTNEAKKRFKLDHPKLGPLLRKYELARLRYRESHPDADDALVKFYDYSSIFGRTRKRKGV